MSTEHSIARSTDVDDNFYRVAYGSTSDSILLADALALYHMDARVCFRSMLFNETDAQ